MVNPMANYKYTIRPGDRNPRIIPIVKYASYTINRVKYYTEFPYEVISSKLGFIGAFKNEKEAWNGIRESEKDLQWMTEKRKTRR